MKIHYYRVVGTSTVGFRRLLARVHESSRRDIAVPSGRGQKEMVMESLTVDGGHCSMDFTHRRMTHGPGFSERGAQTVDFDEITEGGGYGEQAAVVWHSNTRYAAVQYNNWGPKARDIGAYLSHFVNGHGAVSFEPAMTRGALVDLKRKGRAITKFEVAWDRSLTSEEMTAGLSVGAPLSALLALQDTTNAMHLSVSLSVGRGRRPSGDGGLDLDELVEGIQALSPTVAKVKREGQARPRNLLEHLEGEEIDDAELPLTKGRRLAYEGRVKAMKDRLDRWVSRRQ